MRKKCPNCWEPMGSNEMFCSGACREEWNDARRAKEDAKTPYEKIQDESVGCLVMSTVATIFFSFPVVARFIFRSTPVLDNNDVNPHEEGGFYFVVGMFALFASIFASITFILIRKMIRDDKEERLNQAKEEKKNHRFPPR